MFVRVKSKSGYYRSIVYAVLGIGWYEQYIVINPISNEFEMISYLDKTVNPAQPLIEIIQSDVSQFNTYEGAALLKLKQKCKEIGVDTAHLFPLRGYCDICSNLDFIVDILLHLAVPANKYHIERLDLSDKAKWNYILTPEDAENFMKMFAGFHDSTLEKALYSEDYRASSVCMTFDNTGWYGIAELCFEGVQSLRIVPPPENCSREIHDASLIIQDESVFWADSFMKEIDNNYSGSFVKALCLKWRRIEE